MRILSPITRELDIHCLTTKSTNFFLFSLDSKSGLHCLNSMFRKSFYKLNSPKERLFLSTSFLNCFHNHQKQHHFFLIDFHLIKHFLNKRTANSQYVDFKGLTSRTATTHSISPISTVIEVFRHRFNIFL